MVGSCCDWQWDMSMDNTVLWLCLLLCCEHISELMSINGDMYLLMILYRDSPIQEEGSAPVDENDLPNLSLDSPLNIVEPSFPLDVDVQPNAVHREVTDGELY